jgi:glycerol-3-phosphate O-acyltransferase
MAMFSYPMMPPPTTTEKAVGERRITHFTPVGISVCEELDVASIVAGSGEDKESQQKAVASAALEAVRAEYKALEEALFADASKRSKSFVQPWVKAPALA